MSLKDWVDIATIFSLLVASGAAIYGLTAWRVETKRKFEWELARRTLRATYRVRDAIAGFRGSAINLQASGAGPWDVIREAYLELGEILPEVEAAWKKPARARFDHLIMLRERLAIADTDANGGPGMAALPKEEQIRVWNLLNSSEPWDEPPGSRGPDEFRLEMDAAVKSIEGFLQSKMSL